MLKIDFLYSFKSKFKAMLNKFPHSPIMEIRLDATIHIHSTVEINNQFPLESLHYAESAKHKLRAMVHKSIGICHRTSLRGELFSNFKLL